MRVGVGIVGCGVVSRVYLRNLLRFPDLRVVACADQDVERARAFAAEFGIPVSGDPRAVIDNSAVEIVVNLTNPAAHADVSLAAIAAGKHVYTEKPIALEPGSARRLLTAAAAAGVRIGAAPDTFLGAGVQSGVRLIERGAIGVPLTAVTLMQGPGPEAWHPNPRFLYERGAGPLLDMGPYNLTALAIIFGSLSRVAATARQSKSRRVVATGPHRDESFPVQAQTHYSVLLEFAAGGAGTAVFSCDSPVHRFDFLEITGTDATLAMPSPNAYSGPCRLRRENDDRWTTVSDPVDTGGRGVGVLEMARALRGGRRHRNDAGLALHILDAMTAIDDSVEHSAFVPVTSDFTRPELLPEDWSPEALTLE